LNSNFQSNNSDILFRVNLSDEKNKNNKYEELTNEITKLFKGTKG
jgi:hypothetical protein